MSIERKLAAIMFTDIAGYTEQMSQDQDVAFVLLEEKQSKFKPLIKEHNGTLIKEELQVVIISLLLYIGQKENGLRL